METNEPVVNLKLDSIIPNPYQPRKSFNDNTLNELALSIREYGVINPILVRQQGDKYEIIAGERRVKAAKKAGLTEIPAIVRNIEDSKMAEIALIENLQRENITPIEEAESYQTILKLLNITENKLSEMIGKSQSSISNKIRLLNLPKNIQNALLERKISERHARALLSVNNEEEQTKLLKKILAEKMTVKELENEINKKNKKEEKESENMNNESFFPNFNNNTTQNNNMSLNTMNMQASVAPQVEIAPMNAAPMNAAPMMPEQNLEVPNMNAPIIQAASPVVAPEMQAPAPAINEPVVSPIPDFGVNSQIQPEMTPVMPSPAPVLPEVNAAPPVDQQPVMEPLNNIPLFDSQNFTQESAPMPEVTQEVAEAPIPNTMEQVPVTENIPPMVDQPLFTAPVQEPTLAQNDVANAINEASFEIPVTASPVAEADKFTQVKDLLAQNGINYKAYSNETGHCIIIEL